MPTDAELLRPTINRLWVSLMDQANKEGWPAERFLSAMMEHELAERETRHLDRELNRQVFLDE